MSATLPSRSNQDILESQYSQWSLDPKSVDATWASFFEGFELGMAHLATKKNASSSLPQSLSEETLNFRMRVSNALHTFRSLGHTAAWLDPLSKTAPTPAILSMASLGFTESDMNESVQTQLFRQGKSMPLSAMLKDLRSIYCDRIGFEYMHIHTPEVRQWLQDRIENRLEHPVPPAKKQIGALRWLLEAETFERFLHRRYVGQKRFSVEGGEGLLVALGTIFEGLPALGGKEIVMGMAHRGRLSVLANFLRKPLEVLFYEFTENYVPNMVAGDGDVKYHLGFETVRQTESGDSVGIMLAANPSHLELSTLLSKARPAPASALLMTRSNAKKSSPSSFTVMPPSPAKASLPKC